MLFLDCCIQKGKVVISVIERNEKITTRKELAIMTSTEAMKLGGDLISAGIRICEQQFELLPYRPTLTPYEEGEAKNNR